MTPQINPIDSLIPVIAQAVDEWKLVNSAQAMRSQVKNLLDKESKQITLKLLGFDASYGTWTLDHCNGRAGNSTAGDYLKRVQQDAVNEWLASVCMPVLDDELKARLQKDCQKEYEAHLKLGLVKAVRAQADADAKTLVQTLVGSKQIDSYLKVLTLIQPTNTEN